MLMRLLRLLPCEDAHHVTIMALKYGAGPRAREKTDLSLSLFGKRLRNPIGVAGGADKKAEALAGWSRMGFGMVEAGTVTVDRRPGNPKPRLWRLKPEQGLINWMGWPSEGMEPVLDNLRSFQDKPERKNLMLGANIGSVEGKLEEFAQLAKACSPLVDYLTLNASCPNLEHDCYKDAPEQTAAEQIKACKDAAQGKPVLLKLGPTMDQAVLSRMVGAATEAGVDGFMATNTLAHADRSLVQGLDIDWPKHGGNPIGGYSGPGLLPIACFMVKEIRALVGKDMPIIGVGGVQSGADALRLLDAGANAIQLYTGLVYKGPALVKEIMQALAERRG
ncbi:MAG: dihydroorotate dehydrogenase (quinone) [Alphaproteobacteria bacterium]|nr:dihydroorotate dehydrogenase (quinone) [Alphaproteobacteria bacterium]